MTHNGKEIKNVYTVDNIKELPALFAEVAESFTENEHLIECSVKVGFDSENDKEFVRVICTTFVGDMPKPKRC